AGRVWDIQIEPHVEAMGGLHVLMYESHGPARVDWQLYGRAGRQGAQGVAYPLLALDDELLKRFLPRPLKWVMHTAFDRLGSTRTVSACLWGAQHRAQRFAMQQRKQLNFVQGELRKRLSFVRDWGCARGTRQRGWSWGRPRSNERVGLVAARSWTNRNLL